MLDDVQRGQEMVDALRQSGYRLTKSRQAILQVLQDSDASLSPDELYDLAKAIHPPLGLVTVYRTLELLEELELVRRVHTRDRCHGYARARHERHYVVCRRCGQVAEFPCEGLETVLGNVQERTGYAIDHHLLELTGLCPDCR